jgi:hypothetical protein
MPKDESGPKVPPEVTMSETDFVEAVIEVSGVQGATQKHTVESFSERDPVSVPLEPGGAALNGTVVVSAPSKG